MKIMFSCFRRYKACIKRIRKCIS